MNLNTKRSVTPHFSVGVLSHPRFVPMKTLFILLIAALLAGQAAAQPQTAGQGGTTRPFVLGVTEEMQSQVLGEKRILNIYLPAGYGASDATRYPVIFLLDGSADEDFIHVAGLVQFNTFPWLNQMPESILVGIANVNRKRDFTFPTTVKEDREKYPETGHSDKFISFIESELLPFIDKKYRTSPSRMLIGQSLGGLLATEILEKKPDLFSKYLIISPSIWWDNASILKGDTFNRLRQATGETDIYIAVGNEGPVPGGSGRTMEDDAKSLAGKMEGLGNKNVHVIFDFLPSENHGTIGHQAVFNGFLRLYPKKSENH